MIANTGQTEMAPASVVAEPKATRKANAAKRGANVGSSKRKPGKKATPANKTPKRARDAKRPKKAATSRDGSKTAMILELLKRPGGVTSKELMKITNWQPHSVRGFLSGTIRKKMGLEVISTKGEDGERSYSINA